MTTTDGEAQGLKRASKHPKSTTYGRQNPIAERWNSESQLILWRSAWADIVNRHLERVGSAERVDHRSHAERGLDEQLTIHEGVAARAMEKKGIISDRCELNRQIKTDNALLRELKDLVAMLTELVADAASSITDQLTKLREKLLMICYQIKVIIRSRDKRTTTIQATQPKLKRYNELMQQIKHKTKARKALVAEQKNTSKLNLIKQHDLSRQITSLTEEIEELRSERKAFCWISTVRTMLASRRCRAKSPPWKPACTSWMSRRKGIRLSWMKPCTSTNSCRVRQKQ